MFLIIEVLSYMGRGFVARGTHSLSEEVPRVA